MTQYHCILILSFQSQLQILRNQMRITFPSLLSLLLLIPAYLTATTQTLELFKRIQSNLSLNQKATYRLHLNDTLPSNNPSLFFEAQGTTYDPQDVPNIIISRGITSWKCIRKELQDICVIDGSQLKGGDVFKVEVSCELECRYSLMAYLGNQYELRFGMPITLNFELKTTFPAVVKIPSEMKFKQVVISCVPSSGFLEAGALYLYANVGKELPTQNVSMFKGKQMWNQGTAIVLENGVDVKAGEEVRVLLVAPKNQSVQFGVYYEGEEVREVGVGRLYEDFCRGETERKYKLVVPEKMANASLVVSMVSYTGRPILSLKQTPNQTHSQLSASTHDSFTGFVISPSFRQQHNLTNTLYFEISSITDASFILYLETTTNAIQLVDLNAVISELENSDINNYVFEFRADEGQKVELVLKTVEFQGAMEYAVRGCMEENCGSMKNINEVWEKQKQWKQFTGTLQKVNGAKYFTFQTTANSTSCTKTQQSQSLSCYLNIICYRSNSSSPLSKYLLSITQTSKDNYLSQQNSNFYRQLADIESYYQFILPFIENVQQVRFNLLELTGDCTMVGSVTSHHPSINEPHSQIAQEGVLVFTKVVEKYYLGVKCEEISSFNIAIFVKRQAAGKDKEKSKEAVELREGVMMKYGITNQEKEAVFRIRKYDTTPFSVQVNPIRGSVLFEVFPSIDGKPLSQPWLSKNNYVSITPQPSSSSSTTSALLQYSIYVHSQAQCYFSILYSNSNTCQFQPLGQPLSLHLNSSCYAFPLSRLDDLNILISSSGYQLELNKLKLNVKVAEKELNITEKVTMVTRAELQVYCPWLSKEYSSNRTDCVVEVRVQGRVEGVMLVVEYGNEEVVLIDGMFRRGRMEGNGGEEPKHMMYHLQGTKSVVLFLDPDNRSDKFSMLAKLVEWDTYIKSDESALYPKTYSQDTFQSYTNKAGQSILLLSEFRILSRNCSSCVLLISVFQQSVAVAGTTSTFSVEITQHMTTLKSGETKLGYIEKQATKDYLITASETKEKVVIVGAFMEGCVGMSLYRLKAEKDSQRERIGYSNNGFMSIPYLSSQPTTSSSYLILQLWGTQSCYYHITQTQTSRKVYQLIQGVYIDLQLQPQEQTYLIYYHSKPQSFRILPMLSYGDIAFQAKQFSELEFESIDELLDTADKNYTFGGFASDSSLKVEKENSAFCYGCYYLVAVRAGGRTAVSVVAHSLKEPVPIRNDRLVHDVLMAGDGIVYAIYSNKSFNLTIDIAFGDLNITLLNTANNQSIPIEVTWRGEYFVLFEPQDRKSPMNMYGNATQFILTVTALKYTSYVLQAIVQKPSIQIQHGHPTHLSLQANTQICVQFNSTKSPHNTFIMIGTPNSNQLQYVVKCWDDSPGGCDATPKQLNSTKLPRNINLQLQSQPLKYSLCLKSISAMNVTVMVSMSEVKVLGEDATLLLMTSSLWSSYLAVYHGAGGTEGSELALEVFECEGRVKVEVSENFESLRMGKGVEMSYMRNSGHLLATYKVNKEGLYFVGIGTKGDQGKEKGAMAMVLVRYATQENQRVYKQLQSTNKQIAYTIQPDQTIFRVSKLNLTDFSQNFTLHLASNKSDLISSTQCGLKLALTAPPALNFSVNTSSSEQILFKIPRQILQKTLGNTPQYYVTVVCQAHKIGNSSNTYHITYTEIEIPNVRAVVQEINKSFIGTLTTIFIVIVVLMVCGYVLVVKKVVSRIRRYINNEEDMFGEEGRDGEHGGGHQAGSENQQQENKAVQIKEMSELTVQPATKVQSEVITHDIQ